MSKQTRSPASVDRSAAADNSPEAINAGAVKALTAMAHEGRLRLLRSLVQAGPEGLLAGELARTAGVGATTASAQLLVLSNAELVTSQRDGRQVIYRANYSSLEGLMGYLLEDCCGGRAEICTPLARRLTTS